MWVYWYPPISNLLQGHDIDLSNSSGLFQTARSPKSHKFAFNCWNILKHVETVNLGLYLYRSVAPGGPGPEKKKRTLQVKFSSAPENPWNGFQPSSLPHGDLHLIWWGHWLSNRDLHEHESRGPILLLGTSEEKPPGAGTWSELETPKEIQDISVTCPKPEIHRISYWAKGLFK